MNRKSQSHNWAVIQVSRGAAAATRSKVRPAAEDSGVWGRQGGSATCLSFHDGVSPRRERTVSEAFVA